MTAYFERQELCPACESDDKEELFACGYDAPRIRDLLVSAYGRWVQKEASTH